MDRLLLVEDRENLRAMLAAALAECFVVDAVADAESALRLVDDGPYDVVVTDVRLPGASGTDLLAAVRDRGDMPEVVLMTAYGAVPDAVAALRAGAYDYLVKPFEPDLLVRVASRAAERHRLLRRTRELERAVSRTDGEFVGASIALENVRKMIDKVARSPIPVLLLGASGTGKEVVAREIHRVSGRSAFVAVNCGAIPENLVEAELFGVKRGAFTGANTDRQGLVESASGGTLFLDEIGDLPLPTQVKLNRVLEEREFRRVGDAEVLRADFRLIAATHVDLEAAVAAGRFRQDLLFRLKVVTMRLPPLRERREDVAMLVARFLQLAAARLGTRAWRVSPEALSVLEAADWPGNARELRHAIEHAAVMAEGDTIDVEHLSDELRATTPKARQGTYRAACERAADTAGRTYLLDLLTELGGNVTRAALEAGVERESLHRLLRKHQIDPGRFRRP
jgi:DNA-binding NtrC family response regulator